MSTDTDIDIYNYKNRQHTVTITVISISVGWSVWLVSLLYLARIKRKIETGKSVNEEDLVLQKKKEFKHFILH